MNLQDLQAALHETAERSGGERRTAELLLDFLEKCSPDRLVGSLGGYGVAAIYRGVGEGPTTLLRADMDALPIPEVLDHGDGSTEEKAFSHRCGHDGHMSILAGVAADLGKRRPDRGRVVLLFQPAEETGEGAKRVLMDDAFSRDLEPDYAFALHNLPGFPKGSVIIRGGVFASASRGMIVRVEGETSHASQPHLGKSPAQAVAQMVQALEAVPQHSSDLAEAAQVTVIHCSVGEADAFGTAPGKAVVMCTMRAHDEDVMRRLEATCSRITRGIADAYGLKTEIEQTQIFPVTENDQRAVRLVETAADQLGFPKIKPPLPFPWSEDFGHFTMRCKGALFGLGSGEEHPNLHNPKYRFPHDIIPYGVAIFGEIIRQVPGEGGDV